MMKLTRRALMTAPSVSVRLPPSQAVSKDYLRVDREADTTSDLGARNEAAYFNYNPFTPTDLKTRYAMPSLNNLLTSVAIEVYFIATLSIGVGILAWSYYAAQKYESVRLPRPTKADK
eukprot:TRINITY_DN65634_c0_g1_i1.p2 TRINITY_DN65634_c0_g1~~TRINITY_DN65634_c0_g1_i1.p2  ORF type:complete len:118 (+),score=32.79 TRINITY_DN65634_c0_g1_i1:110-463(+)